MASPALSIGEVNGHAMGIVLKDLMARAIRTIRAKRLNFVVTEKVGYSGKLDDRFTDADTLAQLVYFKSLRECFPNVGIIAEEQELRIESAPGVNAYFTIDPLDGTKAFTRKQQHGVATMISLVINGEVVAAFIGNVNTGEIIGYRPGTNKVWRLSVFDDVREELAQPIVRPAEIYSLLRDPIEKYESEQARRFVAANPNFRIEGSSIGVWAARLWSMEVQALLLPPGFETPWDSSPVIGISQALGYVFMKPSELREWQPYQPALPIKKEERLHDTLIVHKTMRDELY